MPSSSEGRQGGGSPTEASREVTRILAAVQEGDKNAADALLPLVYAELRRLARSRMSREAPGQTLQPTALVHEAYLRLVGDRSARWQNRAHFFSAAAIAMRRILVERARKRRAVKHGADRKQISLDEGMLAAAPPSEALLALDAALTRLEVHDPRMSRIVTLRYFAGLDLDATARTLGISTATVKREWRYAKAWLHREITGSASVERDEGNSAR